jgi:ABC-type glycerol-3-phosphate transport system substrate-binding protein
MANNFLTIEDQLMRMIANPFSIARRFNDLVAAQEGLGVWYIEMQHQPLAIDFFYVGGDASGWTNRRPNIFQRLWTVLANFIASFRRDVDNVGGILGDDVYVHTTIDVWIARGMEWAEAIKEMADEDFTPYTGIAINVNVLPPGQIVAGNVNAIMLAIASGRAPDVALGVDVITPVEFAIRDAVMDLSGMPGFDEVRERFVPATITPYEWEGGVYALPETMNFNVMFYRRDIMSMLDLQLPDTRQQLYEFVLPVLYQNGMEFFFGREFSQFLFQHGGDFYTEDLRRSGLNTPEAFRAFEEYTQLFTHFGVPIQANFYQRMRMGIMPLGIGDFGLYMQLSVAAPELVGRWGIAPLPGIEREDGVIDRTAGAIAAQGAMILEQTEHPYEAWEFLKWWTSADTQTAFAREVEALIGAEARWNTANVEAFLGLPWSQEDIDVLQEQWYWAREMPTILGGYFTNRYIVNAWTTVVMEGGNTREALERAVRSINRELRMRQEEYGLFFDD